MNQTCKIPEQTRSVSFMHQVERLLPRGGHLDMCLTCGLCSAGCPATGLEGMDPRKFLRMAALGMDEEIISTPWIWMCTMCRRCTHVCPMSIDIPQLVFHAREAVARDERPSGIVGSCDMALKTDARSAMGISPEDFKFVVEDVLEEIRETQDCCKDLEAPINKKNAHFYLNQNSREPVTEPDEMVPLWKILDYVGADWTYGTAGWAAENYCMFAADTDAWREIVESKVKAVEELGAKVWLNTE
jgi:ferredoxin